MGHDYSLPEEVHQGTRYIRESGRMDEVRHGQAVDMLCPKISPGVEDALELALPGTVKGEQHDSDLDDPVVGTWEKPRCLHVNGGESELLQISSA